MLWEVNSSTLQSKNRQQRNQLLLGETTISVKQERNGLVSIMECHFGGIKALTKTASISWGAI